MPDDDTNETEPTEQHGSSDDHVQSLGEDRYVISLDDPTPHEDGAGGPDSSPDGAPDRRLDDLNGAYAFELHARHGSEADSLRVETNDVTDAFESLLRWYAGAVAADTPTETVVATLLANSTLELDGGGHAGSSRS